MSYVERRDLNRPTEGEAPFQVGETFFSRTDHRGVIMAGNEIFRRVSAYQWDELVGAPHKLIRHPDMPKGVFQLLWDTILGGEPIAAYVKNKAKDGLYYWVLAVVIPAEDGFLSVRIKPSCGLLSTVEDLYHTLRQREENEGLSPKQSAKILLETIADLGFEDYRAFETHALGSEITSMNALGNLPVDKSISCFREITTAVGDLEAHTNELALFFENVSTIPTNLRILASRLEPAGGPLSALSENYWKMSDEMATWFTNFLSSTGNAFGCIHSAVANAMLLNCASITLRGATEQFSKERRQITGFDVKEERKRVSKLVETYNQKAATSMLRAEAESKIITATISTLRHHILALSTTRVMCKIESAALPNAGESLIDIIENFERFQKTAEQIITSMEAQNSKILSNTLAIKSLF